MAEALVLGLLQSTNRPYNVQVGCRGLSPAAAAASPAAPFLPNLTPLAVAIRRVWRTCWQPRA
jgi:hypothetical protein